MMLKSNRLLCFVLLAYATITAQAQMKWSQNFQNYFDQYKDLAIEQMLRFRIPASITLAQGVFESGAGNSRLAVLGNNHFGIKCHDWTGRTITEDDDYNGECFRAYDDAKQSYEDHSKFLSRNQRYARLFQLSIKDYKGWARGLKDCGYATNPNYANKIIDIIELYRLYQYDEAKSYDRFIAQHSGKDQPVKKGGNLHPIKLYNKNYYLFAREGDTFKSIGQETELSGKKIARYNERDYNDVLHEGDIIYLKKKQKRALKTFKNRPHTVKAGESMYSIAQLYGIRLKYLYKMNDFTPDHNIRVGEIIRIY